ncbi:hypothetical protein PSHT_09806 [Puccinia striiformis]|uniref:Uncharacterized protein n=1 Tax=Puccinia striiformis TaxID=27350 RepID=A0A2S4VEA2_9BASI|nr:hypothetical protein PSHT_09806 [Puccinia striiformis]
MNDGPGQEKAALESVRRRLVKHAWLLYLDTILYCPILVYMLRHAPWELTPPPPSMAFDYRHLAFLQQNIFLSRSDLDGSGTSGLSNLLRSTSCEDSDHFLFSSGDACAYRHYWECVSGETVK